MMKAWKFLVPSDQYYPLTSDPDIAFKGCVAVAIAESEIEARGVLTRAAAEEGGDARWLEVARVTSYDLDTPKRLAVAMV